MKHARPDYDRIQDPAGLIPDDEPVFLLRGQDSCAPGAVEAWARYAQAKGAAENIVRAAFRQATEMRAWQVRERRKVPDMDTP